MRHADVCACRDCGVAALNAIMEEMPDTEGKAVVALAGLKLGISPLDVDRVALPYPEVLTSAQRMLAVVRTMGTIGSEHLQDPHAGPFSDLVERMEEELRVLTRSWKRD